MVLHGAHQAGRSRPHSHQLTTIEVTISSFAFREQDKIGWDNLLKGRMGKQWIEYMKNT
jgi:hypothetical protein